MLFRSDGMRRHLITLERARRNLHQSMALCQELTAQDVPISQLDTEALLSRMEALEASGTSFQDVTTQDIRSRYVAPMAVAAVVVSVMAAIIGLILWGISIDPAQAPPIWIVAIIVSFFAAVGVGTLAALAQRIREIRKGEIDDAKKY